MRNDVAHSSPASAASPTITTDAARFLWPPLILAIAVLWCVPMGTGLGLDESGNWWVVKDGVREMIARARVWPGGQSILFNLMVIAARAIGGDSDVVMRVPSLLMAVATVPILYRLGVRLASPLAGMFACLAFVTMGEVIYVASVLRPYSLAIFLAVAAMLMLIRWLDTGERRYGIAYAILAALTLYATVVYATMFVVQAVYAVHRIRTRDCAIGYPALLAAWAASGVLLVPLAQQYLAYYARRNGFVYLSVPSTADVLSSVVPPILAGVIGLGLLIAAVLRRPLTMEPSANESAANTRPSPDRSSVWLAALWALTPPTLLLLLSLFTNLHLFAGRFYLTNAPGVALAGGIVLSRIRPAGTGRLLATMMLVCSILVYAVEQRSQRGLHDFRGAIEVVRSWNVQAETPVLVVPLFVESYSLESIQNPALFEATFSPQLRYRMPGHIIGLPITLSDEAQAYLERVFLKTLKESPRFVFFGPLSAEFYRTWLMGRSRESGFVIRSQSVRGGIGVVLFERADAR